MCCVTLSWMLKPIMRLSQQKGRTFLTEGVQLEVMPLQRHNQQESCRLQGGWACRAFHAVPHMWPPAWTNSSYKIVRANLQSIMKLRFCEPCRTAGVPCYAQDGQVSHNTPCGYLGLLLVFEHGYCFFFFTTNSIRLGNAWVYLL